MKYINILILMILISCNNNQKTGFDNFKKFSDLNIAFFCGGSENDPFAKIVYNGALSAENELGCQVQYIFSSWNSDKMVEQFSDLVTKGDVDGIAIMGHPGDQKFSRLIDEAINKGILVTSQNANLPSSELKYSAKGFGYVGQDLYNSGKILAEGCIQRANLKKNDKVLVIGMLSRPVRGKRTEGCLDVFKGNEINIEYLEITDEIDSEISLATPIIKGIMDKSKDIKLILTDHGALTSNLSVILESNGKLPGEVFGAGFDLTPSTAKSIEEGWIGAVLDQQPFLQGFLPILQICLSKKFGFSGLHIDTGSAIVDRTNIAVIKTLIYDGVR